MEISDKLGMLHYYAIGYSNMGILFRENKDLDSALDYFRKSFGLYKKLGMEKDAREVEILIKSIKSKSSS